MKWLAVSALVSLMRVRSVWVGALSLHPSSAKYCLILCGVSMGQVEWFLGNVLLVLEFQIFSQVVHVDFVVVDCECCRCNVCHEVIDVPAGHLKGTAQVSEPSWNNH